MGNGVNGFPRAGSFLVLAGDGVGKPRVSEAFIGGLRDEALRERHRRKAGGEGIRGVAEVASGAGDDMRWTGAGNVAEVVTVVSASRPRSGQEDDEDDAEPEGFPSVERAR